MTSRKHYREAAALIRRVTVAADAEGGHAVIDRDRLIDGLVTIFADDNPRFSPARFREACNGPVLYDTPSGNAVDGEIGHSVSCSCDSCLGIA